MQKLIENFFKEMTDSKLDVKNKILHKTVNQCIDDLDQGKLKLCTYDSDKNIWTLHEWLKQSILLFFKINKMEVVLSDNFSFVDKIPLKQWTKEQGVRVVPQALARKGSFIESGCILMPSYINIGAHVGAGTMIDTWATIGSCAQVGKNVHVSGGVGLGGVLEPLQARPVIIEDNVFLGSRVSVVEGFLVKQSAVIASGVNLTASTYIIDVSGEFENYESKINNKKVFDDNGARIFKLEVPENAVVIQGTRNKVFKKGEYPVSCALIIGKRSESTDKKTSLNQVLRDIN
ncbi:MAG: 2,3,4,5-tetrahydropyridine-2,6-dicarboxylate N-succinyltransferase [Bdellovibrionales bacterium]|nr:2,3,4,5-tetrahydropyridine-2,6-dicarboxylate N-succinyltransferase [Bdellovibrionales bacterium]